MSNVGRPRHIRDIAHLYLSNRQNGTSAAPVALFVAGTRKDCFPGLHVANLAAALATRNTRVRVYELSDLLPNACVYFSLPPIVYLGARDRDVAGFIPGLNGIEVAFNASLLGAPAVGASTLVNIVHLPLATDERATDRFLELQDQVDGEVWAMVLTGWEDDGGELIGVFEEELGPYRTLFLSTGRSGVSPGIGRPGDLGALGGWQQTLDDRVPVVVRAPDAALTMGYLSICDSLLGRLSMTRRRRRAGPTSRVFSSAASRR